MSLGENTPQKLQRLRALLAHEGLDAIWLRHHANVAWVCDGARTHIHLAEDAGVVSVLVTQDGAWAITNAIEHARLRDEEGMASWHFVSRPWTAGPFQPEEQLGAHARWASDLPTAAAATQNAAHTVHAADAMQSAVLALRTPLLPAETARLRALGAATSHALHAAMAALRPPISEHAIAAAAAQALCAIGAEPVVMLVAGDARITQVRHPLPTAREVTQVAMVVVCARRHGLVVSMTRFITFAEAPAPLLKSLADVAYVDASIIAQTRPGTSYASLWQSLQNAYTQVGHPQSWQGLHQGGPCSYAPRDMLLTPDAPHVVQDGQAFAWNPSLPGAKSEDTLLCTHQGVELLTQGPWPVQDVVVDGVTWQRPGILRVL